MSVRRASVVLIALAVCGGAAACIIGPKQDDPAESRPLDDVGMSADSASALDLGTASDTDLASGADTAAPPQATDGDADASDADVRTDASDGEVATDSVTEGG